MANMSSLEPISRPYEFWSIKMKTFLYLNKFWDMVETEFKKPDTITLVTMNNAKKSVVEAFRDQDLTATWLI